MVEAEILAGTSTASKLVFQSAFAEFERTKIRKRVKAGLWEARPTRSSATEDDGGVG
jgi:DNA invertase Pin-like site-specific DNA recombinase